MIKKHKIVINLNWSSIDRDVQDKAYRMARLTKLGIQDAAAADKYESEITLTEEDMALLKRAMTEALAEVVTMCREYVWNKSHTSDNYTIKEDNVELILMMPVNFNLAGAYSLGKMMHAYIVAKAMLEWYRYTVPPRASEQQAICDRARLEIETIINARVRTRRQGEGLEVIVGEESSSKVYIGLTSSATIDGIAVTSLEVHSSGDSCTLTAAEGDYLWLCVPASMSSSAITSSGFAVPMDEIQSVELDGNGTYVCYRSPEAYTAGTYTFKIS